MPIALIVWGLSAFSSGIFVAHNLNQAQNRKAALAREQEKQEKAKGD